MKRIENKELERTIGERFEIEPLPDGRVRISGLVWKGNDLVEKGSIEELGDIRESQAIEAKLVEYPLDDGHFGGDPLFGRIREDGERIRQQYEALRYQAILKQAPEGATAFKVLRRHPDPEFLHREQGMPLEAIALVYQKNHSRDLVRYS